MTPPPAFDVVAWSARDAFRRSPSSANIPTALSSSSGDDQAIFALWQAALAKREARLSLQAKLRRAEENRRFKMETAMDSSRHDALSSSSALRKDAPVNSSESAKSRPPSQEEREDLKRMRPTVEMGQEEWDV